MFDIEFSINILTLVSIVLAAGLIGYIFRSRQIKKKQFKISELRKEIIYNHAHILELQKEYVTLESKMKIPQTPVLSLKNTANYTEETQKVSEAAAM